MKAPITASAIFLLSACAPGAPGESGERGDELGGESAREHAEAAAPEKVATVRDVDLEIAPRQTATSDAIEVSEPGATFVKVRFAGIDLEPGEELAIESPGGEVVEALSPVEAKDAVWSASVRGDAALVSLRGAGADSESRVAIDGVAAGTEDLGAVGPEPRSICGEDAKEAAACYGDELGDPARAVARMIFETGGGLAVCTGSLVSPDGLFLTNNHCVADQDDVDTIEVQFDYQTDSCEGDDNPSAVSVTGGELVATSFGLDYTLIELPENMAERFGHLELDPIDVERGHEIFIPQHPGGRPKEIAAFDSTIDDTCRVQTLNQSILPYDPESNMGYRCDTEGGSSGSPVISRETGGVIALHHLGGCENNGTYIRDIYPEIEAHLAGGARD